MAERNTSELIHASAISHHHLCVGLDTSISEVHKALKGGLRLATSAQPSDADLVVAYNRMVVEQTADIAKFYKPNLAFYEDLGDDSVRAVRRTVEDIHAITPTAVVIIDAKYGDIGSTNEPLARKAFDHLQGDAVTLHNYMGKIAMGPFLDRKDKVSFVLARTSNDGNGETQDVRVKVQGKEEHEEDEIPYFQYIAQRVSRSWNTFNNVGLVVGATYPEEAGVIRDLVGSDVPLLIPGVGAQGGTAGDIVPKALREFECGAINSSRGITFAKPQEGESYQQAIRRAALSLHTEIKTAQRYG